MSLLDCFPVSTLASSFSSYSLRQVNSPTEVNIMVKTNLLHIVPDWRGLLLEKNSYKPQASNENKNLCNKNCSSIRLAEMEEALQPGPIKLQCYANNKQPCHNHPH